MKRLPSDLREVLKKPLGKIVSPQMAEPNSIVVGDYSAYVLISNGKMPKIVIHDNRIMRENADETIQKIIKGFGNLVFKVKNPPGHISDEAEDIIKIVLEEGKTNVRIEVLGEEDLLTLPVILHAPFGAKIYYGQPDVGLVEVEVTENIKRFVEKILSQMEEIA